MKRQHVPYLCAVGSLIAAMTLAAPPEVNNVTASQRADTKLVDIRYDITDPDGDLMKVRVEISDNDGHRYSVPAFSLTGDIGDGIASGAGKHIVWDAGKDWDGEYSDQMRVKVFAIDGQGYPGMAWGNEVPPGGFLLGQDGGVEGSGPSRHVNIPWSYWLSKYEITRGQYCDFLNAALVAGFVERDGTTAVYSKSDSPLFTETVDRFKLINIGDGQGIRWNVNNFEIVNSQTNYPVAVTWYGALAFSHFYGYDLPTEAEWEKAARGPDHDDEDEHLLYPWGNSITTGYAAYNGTVKPVGYYDGNQTPIGPDTVNGYGLYDVVGNYSEWTLTLSSMVGIETYPQQEYLFDYGHNVSVRGNRVIKGYSSDGLYIRKVQSESRDYYSSYSLGFRVCRRSVEATQRALVREVFDDLESWPIYVGSGSGVYSNITAAGTWETSGRANLKDNSGFAASGSKYMTGYDGYNFTLYLPPTSNQLSEVHLKVRNTYSSSLTIDLRSGNSSNSDYSSHAVTIPANSGWRDVILYATRYGASYWISTDGYLSIDDIELWTIPAQ